MAEKKRNKRTEIEQSAAEPAAPAEVSQSAASAAAPAETETSFEINEEESAVYEETLFKKQRAKSKSAPKKETEVKAEKETGEETPQQLSFDLSECEEKSAQTSYYEYDDKENSPLMSIFKSIKKKFSKKDKAAKPKKKKFNPLPAVSATRYHPDPAVGLNDEQLAERFENDLVNKVENKYSKSYASIFIGNIFTFFNLLGLICAVALIVAGASLNRFMFCLVYIANIGIGIIQEIRAKLSIEKLALLSSHSAKVVRNGAVTEISTGDIVLDDILHFTVGNQISTDSIIEEGTVEVNESLLTGESVAVKKSVGDELFAGSFITGGNCVARANKVGKENYVEILSAKAKKYRKPHSELMRSTQLIITCVGFLIVPMAIGMFFKLAHNINDWKLVIEGTSAVIIGMIPAGMMLLTSLALAVGVIRMARNQTLVQDLYSLEMLARIDVLCLDKTGTITDGRMKVSDCLILSNSFPDTISEAMGSMLSALDDNNQTSIALNNHFGRNNKLKPVKLLPFNSDRKCSAVTFAESGTYAFGAPEFVLKEVPDNVAKMVKQYASMGLRVLVVAYSKAGIVGETLPASMKAIALITISDNIREDAVSTIRWFKQNDVQIKIISGDNPITVSEVARRAGVENADKYISLEGLSESEVISVANKYTVFGRVSPEQKAILVRAIKAAGHNAAMTGDGVNDILALKEANCAITVGSGSDAARNVSHIVLMDNNFASMPKVVHEGRRVINNIQNSASLYLMKTFFITLLAFFVIVIPGAVYPFNTSHMMLIEFVIIGVASFFLSFQANDSRVKGRFINYVICKSLPGGLLMLISVLIIMLAQGLLQPHLGIENYPNDIYYTMMEHAMNFAGLVMLYRLCKPFNAFRTLLFVAIAIVLTGISIFAVVQGLPMFSFVSMGNLDLYWHHILLLGCVILLCIALAGVLENIANKFLITQDKTKEKSKKTK
ncbi:MAG: ATPase P [Bacillota bacterium]|nr:MAG: ATPase P [Bacillota bacterium]